MTGSRTTGAAPYVVVGAGLVGAATAWQLARRGHQVTLLERSTPANVRGSSHGSARIFRYAYADPFYAGLVVQARSHWDELERVSGRRLVTTTGSVDFGAGRDPAHLAGVLTDVGVESELLDARAARTRWPMIRFEGDVVWHAAAGVLDARTSVLAMVEAATACGARVETGWTVGDVTSTATGLRVRSTDGRTRDAGHVVVAAGGWLPELLGHLDLPERFLGAFPPLQVMEESVYHFPYRGGPDEARAWPTFIHKSDEIQVYGLPGGRDADFRGQKIAEYNGGRSIGTASTRSGAVDPDNRARVVDFVRRTLPGLVPEPYAEATCLFTNTPTEDFVVDGVDGVTIASPCSGHGAKFAPLLGRIIADVADGSAPPPEPFTLAAARSRGAARR